MSTVEIIRAWKDEEYRLSLSEEQRAQLPEHPAGLIELSDAELVGVVGGLPPGTTFTNFSLCSVGCPTTSNPHVCHPVTHGLCN